MGPRSGSRTRSRAGSDRPHSRGGGSSVVGPGVPRIVAGHRADVGAVGGRLITALRGPQPVDTGSVSIPRVESLVLSIPLGAYRGRGVGGGVDQHQGDGKTVWFVMGDSDSRPSDPPER
jgi:hypothetical protein